MELTRVASVSYLNALPLTRGLTHGTLQGRFQVLLRSPAECARLLREGLVDVALLPSVEFARIPGLSAIPGCGVSSKKEVRSVLLLTHKPLNQVRSLAVDIHSRTSVALSQIVLRRRHGSIPVITAMPPDPVAMLAGHDAALMIGDAALRAHHETMEGRHDWRLVDLASEWNEMTGMPFVFALWACRPVVDQEAVRRLLAQSLEEGLAAIQAIAAEESGRTGLPAASITSYLTSSLHHRLGEEESESLRIFLRFCREDGLLGDQRAAVRAPSPSIRSATLNNG